MEKYVTDYSDSGFSPKWHYDLFKASAILGHITLAKSMWKKICRKDILFSSYESPLTIEDFKALGEKFSLKFEFLINHRNSLKEW